MTARLVDGADTDRTRWRLVAFAAGALLVCTNGPSTFIGLELLRPRDLRVESWHFVYPFGIVAIGGSTLLARHIRPDGVRSLGWAAVPLAAFLAVTLASGTWSVAPELTSGRALLGVGIAAFAVWFGRCLRLEEQMWSVFLGVHAGLAASIGLLVAAPARAKTDPFLNHPYWRGIWGNRNSLAPVCVLAILTTGGLVLAIRDPRARIGLGALVPVDAILLWGARSDTALAALLMSALAAVCLAACLPSLQRRGVPGWGLAALGAIVIAVGWRVLFGHIDRFTELVGKDSSFTSRRPIWQAVRQLAHLHLARGYGWWAIWDSPVVADLYARLGPFGSAHNGLLEVILGVGLLGAVPFVGFVAFAVARPVRNTWSGADSAGAWWVAVVTFTLVENLTESFVLWNSYIWVLLIAAAFVPAASTQHRRPAGDARPPRRAAARNDTPAAALGQPKETAQP